ncbi:glycoside hydrolase family 63 protein [Sodiomyces alcalophilus JCM 7366]|uniref:glycoside hydrolase family 63 protein n=1 Tax=Sodiomyces alcalophilus JCM 7366 TaxID=591952 RepID=UPI0039B69776
MAQRRRLTVFLAFIFLHLNGLHLVLAAGEADGAESSEAGPGPASILNSEVARLNNESLFWGPYKPNLYFGVQPRTPKALWTGLMWSKVENYQDVQKGFRYTCEQHEIDGYGWEEYDARRGGIQSIHDEGNQIDITTSFVKVPAGAHGGSWAARIKGVPREGAPDDLKTMVHYYIAQEDPDAELLVENKDTGLGFEGDVIFQGRSENLGNYKLVVTAGEGGRPSNHHPLAEVRDGAFTTIRSLELPPELVWQARGIVYRQIQDSVKSLQNHHKLEEPLPPWVTYQLENSPGKGNVHVVQKMFEGAFEFDVIFSSASAGSELTSEDVTREIQTNSEFFGSRFSSIFDLKAPFTAEKYQKFGKSMLSNLMGGIGYFYGDHLVDRSNAPEYEEEDEGFWEEAAAARARHTPLSEGPFELYTSVPSRPFFPRGFLWDEGFHLVPIAEWDIDLTLDIVKSWYSLMDEDGWIGREMILGHEARSRVPEEFQVQYPHYANPPTLFLIIEGFMERLRRANGTQSTEEDGPSTADNLRTALLDDVGLGESYLRHLYPLLRRQFSWFRDTQRGEIKAYDRETFSSKEAYRWRGRTESHLLTSGLDDYPRPLPPHPGELHVDLMSWVGLMAKSLMNIAGALGITDEAAEYEKILTAIQRNLNDLHWSEEEGCYCDATIDEFEEHALVCHRGYISLFPFLVGLMQPDDPKLGRLLDLIGDEKELFSPYGIRSLSKKHELYGTGENYWKSPIWININYMVIAQLKNIATQEGPFQDRAKDLYTRLRKNVVDNVFKNWEETGFAWEQYNPENGKGQRIQHFTGWTSLVVSIMAMDDLGEDGHIRDEL